MPGRARRGVDGAPECCLPTHRRTPPLSPAAWVPPSPPGCQASPAAWASSPWAYYLWTTSWRSSWASSWSPSSIRVASPEGEMTEQSGKLHHELSRPPAGPHSVTPAASTLFGSAIPRGAADSTGPALPVTPGAGEGGDGCSGSSLLITRGHKGSATEATPAPPPHAPPGSL